MQKDRSDNKVPGHNNENSLLNATSNYEHSLLEQMRIAMHFESGSCKANDNKEPEG